MKHILFIFMFWGSIQLNAQISIYREDFGFPNEWFLIATDNEVDPEELASLLANGANASWDATGIRPQYQDTFFYLSPADFPSAPENCNLIFSNPVMSSLPDFYQANSAQIQQIVQPDGFFGAEGKLVYLNFPSVYGSSIADSFETQFKTLAVDLGIPANPLFDSAQITFRSVLISDFNGYGTIRTKFNQFPVQVLKRKLIKKQRTIFKVRNKLSGSYVDIPGGFDPGGINTDNTFYQWFGSNSGVPILEFQMDTLFKAKNLKYLVNSSRLISLGLENIHLNQMVGLYPNPGSEYFSVSTPENANIDEICIYDLNGQLLNRFQNINSDTRIYPEIASDGIYLVQIKIKEQVAYKRWKK